jgi:murein DD-endopeptidase MepM/ murein hydrolase activator NlpD
MKTFIVAYRFALLSWGVTLLVVAGLLGFAYMRLQTSLEMVVAAPQEDVVQSGSGGPILADASVYQWASDFAIGRNLTLKTMIPERPRYEVITHTVQRGDSIFGISQRFDIKPDTLLWANFETLKDDPHSLRPGMELNIPPTNGVYYRWKDGDDIEQVAAELRADPVDIVNWPGNKLDLADPEIEPETWVMVPGGEREYQQWIVPTIAVGRSGTTNVGGSVCNPGAVGTGGFIWPAANRFLSGNDYYPGHLAIDIAAGEGSPIYAADSGVVTMAAGGWNGGYGNVVQINHGNGYVTLYAHLSVINVSVCQSVGRGQTVGAAGNTGNSFGAHLHFEVRLNSGFVNPWFVLP